MTSALLRAFLLALCAGPAAAQEAPSWVELGPFFAERCTLCHSGPDAPLGLHLDSYEGAMAGSVDGPVLVAGDPGGSELIRRVRGESQPQMPLVGDLLSEEEIGRIEAWILAGLPEGAAGPEAPSPPLIAQEPAPPGPDEPVTFAHVERIFLQRCAKCHSDAREGGPPEGLRLDSLEHILAGGERLALIPGNAVASEIVRRIEGTAQPRMPFDGPPWLEDGQIELIRRWIAEGAQDAEGTPAPIPVGREVRYRGVLTGPEEIDGIGFAVTPGTRIDDRPAVGQGAEVRGVVTGDGGIEATRFRDR